MSSIDNAAAEFFEERAAIRQYCGRQTRTEAEIQAAAETEKFREECEARFVAEKFRGEGKQAVVDFLALVEKSRGKDAAEKLRIAALAELEKIKKARM